MVVRIRPLGRGLCPKEAILAPWALRGAPPGLEEWMGALYCLHNSLKPPKDQSTLPLSAGLALFSGDRYYCENQVSFPPFSSGGGEPQVRTLSPVLPMGVQPLGCQHPLLPLRHTFLGASKQPWERSPRKLLTGRQAVTLSF